MMACFVPFNNRNLEICFLVFRPTIVLVDDLLESLKDFCLFTESIGCLHSAVFTSIHGNMMIWYGTWMKRSNEDKELLTSAFNSMLTNVLTMAILIDQSFYEASAGESRQGSSHVAKFSNGDIISMSSTTLFSNNDTKNEHDFSYACLAIFRTRFLKMEGATAAVCLKSQSNNNNRPRVIGLFIWKSLQYCYSYILNTDYRKTDLPYLEGLSIDVKYDIFRVVFVSENNNALKNLYFHPYSTQGQLQYKTENTV